MSPDAVNLDSMIRASEMRLRRPTRRHSSYFATHCAVAASHLKPSLQNVSLGTRA
jgi:hypothetical protein